MNYGIRMCTTRRFYIVLALTMVVEENSVAFSDMMVDWFKERSRGETGVK